MANVNIEMVRVLTGFTTLSYEQRVEVLNQINDYQENPDYEKRAMLIENFSLRAGVDLGPTNQGLCPCCGK